MRPVVNGLEQEYAGRIRLVTLDYDVKEDLRKAQKLNANYHPAMVFVRPDGTVSRVVIGYQSPESIHRHIETLLAE